jgi:hypothetical protein
VFRTTTGNIIPGIWATEAVDDITTLRFLLNREQIWDDQTAEMVEPVDQDLIDRMPGTRG